MDRMRLAFDLYSGRGKAGLTRWLFAPAVLGVGVCAGVASAAVEAHGFQVVWRICCLAVRYCPAPNLCSRPRRPRHGKEELAAGGIVPQPYGPPEGEATCTRVATPTRTISQSHCTPDTCGTTYLLCRAGAAAWAPGSLCGSRSCVKGALSSAAVTGACRAA